MRFLIQKDYERIITVDDLNQVFDNGTDGTYTVQQRIIDTEPSAIEEISGYIKQRYDISQIFTDTPVFNLANTYNGNNRAQYHEPDFSATTVYTSNQRVNYQGSIYKSIGGSAAHPFVPAEWTFICLDYQLFYVLLPFPAYDYTIKYNLGDQVWFNNGIYTSKNNENIYPPTNTQTWTFNSTFSITGVLPTDGTKWMQGDNRNALLVQKMVDIVLYHAHSTINKRNIPELRIRRYMGDAKENYVATNDNSALGWLTKIASGDMSATLPELPPSTSEMSLRWGNNRGDSQSNNISDTPKMSY